MDPSTSTNDDSSLPMFTESQLRLMHQTFQKHQRSDAPSSAGNTNPVQQGEFSNSYDSQQQSDWLQILQPTPIGSNVNQNFSSMQHQGQQSSIASMQNLSSVGSSLFTLGSSVEPVQHNSRQAYPGFWNVDDATSGTFKTAQSHHSFPSQGGTFPTDNLSSKRKWTDGADQMSYNMIQFQQPQRQYFPHSHASESSHQVSTNKTEGMDEGNDWAPTPLSQLHTADQRSSTGASPMLTSSNVELASPPATLAQQNLLRQYQNNHQMQTSEEVTARPPISEKEYAMLLPSTLMPPSVLTSVLPGGNKTTSSHGQGGNSYRKKTGTKSFRTESPLDVLQRLLSLQGYGPMIRIAADDAQYETVPSALQLASFGTELVKAIHASDTDKLSTLLRTGLSPNPCNKFRDSMLDLVCKRANAKIFRCLVEHGCDLRVCDGFGRTPLHHCCWANEFSHEIAEIIIGIDIQQLFIEDKRGQTPLEYVRPDQAAEWVEFLEDNKDRFFPRGRNLPQLYSVRQSRPDNMLRDPAKALPVELASAISSGRLAPEELANMDPTYRARFT